MTKQLLIIHDPSTAAEHTTYSLARQAVALFPRTSYTDRKSVNALRRGWVRGIAYLGDKWILAKSNHILRRQAGYADVDVVVFFGTVTLFICSLIFGI